MSYCGPFFIGQNFQTTFPNYLYTKKTERMFFVHSNVRQRRQTDLSEPYTKKHKENFLHRSSTESLKAFRVIDYVFELSAFEVWSITQSTSIGIQFLQYYVVIFSLRKKWSFLAYEILFYVSVAVKRPMKPIRCLWLLRSKVIRTRGPRWRNRRPGVDAGNRKV